MGIMSYDIKFRERTLAYYEKGHGWDATIETFAISGSTLLSWLKKSDASSLADVPSKSYPRKIPNDELRSYVADHPDAYQSEMTEYFDCSQQAICKALKRIGITRKKDQRLQKTRR